MAFTSKNLQHKKSGLTFIKGATLFFLGMSAVLFLTQAFDIVPSITNRAQLIKEVLFTADGSQSGNTGAYIDGSGGNAYFAGAISGNVVAANIVCLNDDTSILGSCRTEWPTGGTTGGESLWFTGTNSIYYTGGNVGIGTGTPSARLEVNGDVKVGSLLSLYSSQSYGNIQSEGNLVFNTSGSSTPKMIINNSGYVGIGISTPSAKLHVFGSSSSVPVLLAGNTSSNIRFSSDSESMNVHGTSPIGGSWQFGGNDNFSESAFTIGSYSNNPMIFVTSGYERIKLTQQGNLRFISSGYIQAGSLYANQLFLGANGKVGIGTSSPSTKLTVAGDVTANAYYYSSDERLKTDITTISNPLEKILALNGYGFTWKATGKKDIGVIAQEVEKVFPEIVNTNSEGYKSVEYGNLIAPLIEAIKELNTKVDTQAKEIQSLKEMIIR